MFSGGYKCPACGGQNPPDANFCRMCGRKRDEAVIGFHSAVTAPAAQASSVGLPPQTTAVSSFVAAPQVLPQQVLPMGGSIGGLPAVGGSVNSGVVYDSSVALPGDAWESGGCRYRMGDRYLMDGQGGKQSVLRSESPTAAARGLSPTSFRGSTLPGSSSFISYGGGYEPGRYPGSSAAPPRHYGPPTADHMHDLHAAHVIGTSGPHGPLPPSSAPGTPVMLPPYMHPEGSGKAPKRERSKKDKKDRDSSRRKKKGGGCCG